MVITEHSMRCTWHLKKSLDIEYRWAIRTAHELCKISKDWRKVMSTPGGVFYPWSYSNARGILGYIHYIFTEKNSAREQDFDIALEIINTRLLEGVRVSAVEVASALGGELLFYATEYYVASKLKTDVRDSSDDFDIYAPMPRWF